MVMILPIIFPALFGILMFILKKNTDRKVLTGITGAVLVITALLVALALKECSGTSFVLFDLTSTLPVKFSVDGISILFAAVVSIVWVAAGFFSFEYMKHEQNEKRYYGFYLLVYGVLIALCFAGNLVTFYLFYEMMTLLSLPLVLHNQSHEAIMAGLKYLLYSFVGAYLALFGLFTVYHYATSLDFVPGGVMDASLMAGHEGFLLTVSFLMILGFSVKAGMFPMHAWLPTAHPVAPAPASAVLSSIIVKAGVLGIIRVVFYIFGADFIRGTWVQTAWMSLALITVFMGSMLAYREKVLKKRLAYSTVSQLSYILFGLAVMNETAVTGALFHVTAHAFIKCVLFLVAGAIIYKTGITRADKLRGIGKQMPITIWCYTIVSLGLIGIPPTGGFISKWFLATGALEAGEGAIGIFSVLGPVVLLVSALLTAGYLLPITMNGFFPGNKFDYEHLESKEPSPLMWVPILVLCVLSVLIGCFPTALNSFIGTITAALF